MIGYIILAIVAIVIIVMTVRTIRFAPPAAANTDIFDIDVDRAQIAVDLSNAIKIKTISNPDDTLVEWDEFTRYHQYLEDTFPNIHRVMTREVIADYSLMYTWSGKSASKKPLALLSHIDVVPVMPGTEGDWKYAPFSGHIDDEYIWGRGTLDMKCHMIALCSAIEQMIVAGYEPSCDVYLCFGHNEEIVGAGNNGGADAIAHTMEERGIELGMVVDEGGAIIPGRMFNIPQGNMAVIGIAEKGYIDIKVTSNKRGGHSSQPPKRNGLVDLAGLLVALDSNQFKKRFTQPVSALFDAAGRHMSPLMRIMLANLWLTKPLVLFFLQRSAATNALVRTTITPTMAEGSPAGNVLPQRANVSVNSRILQGESISDVVEHIRSCTKGVEFDIELLRGKEPSAISPIDCEEFDIIVNTITQVYGNLPVSPYLMVGGTDSCFYEIVCDNIYRVGPFEMTGHSLEGIHGTNEKIGIDVLAKGAKFYHRLISNYCK